MREPRPGEIIPGNGPCGRCGHFEGYHGLGVSVGIGRCTVCVSSGIAPTICTAYVWSPKRQQPWGPCLNPACGHKMSHHFKAGRCQQRFCTCEEFWFPETYDRMYPPTVEPFTESEPTETTETTDRKDTTHMTTVSYSLPGGREYLSRAIGGYDDDVAAVRDLAKKGKHFLLLGEPGCGKTALIQAAFPNAENEIGHSKMTAWDMLWRPRPMPDGSIIFDPSPLTRAVTKGVPFYLDETMRLSEDAFTPLFSAMDGRGFIVGGNIDGTDMPVKEGFVVIGASNPLVRGAFLPDAIASRFHILTVETSEELLVRMNLDERLLVAWRNLSSTDGGESWRPSIREMLAAQSFIEDGNMAQAAYALTGWRVPARDRDAVASVIAPLLGVRVGALGGVIR